MNWGEGRCRCGTYNCAMSRSEQCPPAAPDYTGGSRRCRSPLLHTLPRRRRFSPRRRARTCRPAFCLRAAACSGHSLSAVSIGLASSEPAGRDVKLPLQRSDHATKRLRRAKQQRLVVAGPVARGVCGECFPRHSISSRGPGALPPEIEQAAGHSLSSSYRPSASAENCRWNYLKLLKKSVKRIRPASNAHNAIRVKRASSAAYPRGSLWLVLVRSYCRQCGPDLVRVPLVGSRARLEIGLRLNGVGANAHAAYDIPTWRR
jgi:hypothetical protein